MSSKRVKKVVDGFCGAGGATMGIHEAFTELGIPYEEIAINHWMPAINTISYNNPNIKAYCMDMSIAKPEKLVPDGYIDLLWMSPSCTHFSRAKGDRPLSDQLRMQPNHVHEWIDRTKEIRNIIIENVPEFMQWGPLDPKTEKPVKRLKGKCFLNWVDGLRARDYIVDWRIVNCADYGDPTTRKRFFLKAVKRGCGHIRWPEPTHAEHPENDLLGLGRKLKPWRTVSECLDYSDIGRSIFDRKTPLAENTMRRVIVGLKKYCNIDLKPFIVKLNRNGTAESVDSPLSTVVSGGGHHLLCRPFLVRANRGCFAESVGRPISSIVAHTNHHALCQPIIIDHCNGGKPTDLSRPLGTQTSHDRFSVINTFVLGQQGGAELRPDTLPMPTISTAGAIRKVDAVILDMSRPGGNDSGHIHSYMEPIQTITTYDNMQGCFALLEDGRLLDVRIRMLKPSELAAAHSFPKDFVLMGNRAEQVKQIGNSVPVMTAKAMVRSTFE